MSEEIKPVEEPPEEKIKKQKKKPKENPKEKETDEILESSTFKIESDEKLLYEFIISKAKTKIDFKLIQKDSFPKIQYISSFSFEDIIKKAKWFKQYDTLDECYDDMIVSLTEKKVNLFKKEENKFINLKINHNEKKNSVFQIIQKDNDDKDIMHQLTTCINILRKDMKEIKEKNKDMEKILFSYVLTEEEKELLKSWIFPENNNNENKLKLKLLFSSRINGEKAKTFHLLCDDKGPTLTIIKSKDGNKFGGYTSISWKSPSSGDYIKDEKAIIFNLDKKKFAKSIDSNSIYCNANYGPSFGGGYDLYICDNFISNNNNYNSTGNGYKFDGEGDYFLNNGTNNFYVEEMFVFNVFLVNDDD